ncbi:MAG: hypothetical protein WCH65_06780 [bacterium]
MENKIKLKLETFEYILYKFAEWHPKYVKDYPSQPSIYRVWRYYTMHKKGKIYNNAEELGERDILFLFFVCTASIDREKMFELFDNFHAMHTEIYDSDCKIEGRCKSDRLAGNIELDVLQNYQFNENSFSKKEKSNPDIPYREIDDAIQRLERIDPYLLYRGRFDLKFLFSRHTSFEMYMYREDSSKILKEILVTEKSYFAAKKELLQWT